MTVMSTPMVETGVTVMAATAETGTDQPDLTTQGIRRLNVWFWVRVLWLTLFNRRVSAAVQAAEARVGKCVVSGIENVPQDDTFVLSVNHYLPTTLIRILGACLQALQQARPDSVDNIMIVAGRTAKPKKRGLLKSIARGFMNWLYRRWHRNVVVIPMESGEQAAISALRGWRRRAKAQPVLVFPEGKARKKFRYLREGAGRWLRGMGVPVIPVAVWHQGGQWHVRFGAPIGWKLPADRTDKELAFEMAKLLPAQLAPDWQKAIARRAKSDS